MYLDELISNLFSDPKNINFSLRKVHLIRKLKGDQNYLTHIKPKCKKASK